MWGARLTWRYSGVRIREATSAVRRSFTVLWPLCVWARDCVASPVLRTRKPRHTACRLDAAVGSSVGVVAARLLEADADGSEPRFIVFARGADRDLGGTAEGGCPP